MDLQNIPFQEGKKGYPRLLSIAGQTGVGKSTLSEGLNVNGHTCLVIDLQEGFRHLSGRILNVKSEARKNNESELRTFFKVIQGLRLLKDGIKEEQTKDGVVRTKVEPFQYDFLWIDPMGDLIPLVKAYASQIANNTVIGKAYARKTATELFSNGNKTYVPTQKDLDKCKITDPTNDLGMNGWSFMQQAFDYIFNALMSIPDKSLILVTHTKMKTLKTELQEVTIKELDIYPTFANFIAKTADDSGFVGLKGDEVWADFKSRPDNEHFKNRNVGNEPILLSKKTGDKIEFYWDKIYPFLKDKK